MPERIEFKEEDFTENELLLLRLAFKLTEEVVDAQVSSNSCLCNMRDDLYDLKQKLGIYELVD